MECPNCHTQPLKEASVPKKHFSVDYCEKCKGVWFDGKELEAAVPVAAKELGVPLSVKATSRMCPRDGSFLHSFDYPQTMVTIDMCKKCRGIWLDHKELDEIRAVRNYLKKKGELETLAPVTGIKGALLKFIAGAMSGLKFDESYSDNE